MKTTDLKKAVTGKNKIESANCGCDTGRGIRRATAVDPEIKSSNQRRLNRIEGQIRGLQRMVSEDRYCADIMTQIASVQEALSGVGRQLLRNHLRHCAAQAIRSGTPAQAEAMYDELLDLLSRKIG
jgi:CsoR family transcriptional regulator, copper-sensing transcriptional repressor